MNSNKLQTKLASDEGRVQKLAGSKLAEPEIINELYLTTCTRFPSKEELQLALAAFSAKDATRRTATEDVMWALINSAEFVFNH